MDAVILVVACLFGPPPIGFGDRLAHGFRRVVGIEDRLPVQIPRRPPHGLNQRTRRTQVAFLIGVQDGDQRDLRQVEPFAQEVNTDQDVELTPP